MAPRAMLMGSKKDKSATSTAVSSAVLADGGAPFSPTSRATGGGGASEAGGAGAGTSSSGGSRNGIEVASAGATGPSALARGVHPDDQSARNKKARGRAASSGATSRIMADVEVVEFTTSPMMKSAWTGAGSMGWSKKGKKGGRGKGRKRRATTRGGIMRKPESAKRAAERRQSQAASPLGAASGSMHDRRAVIARMKGRAVTVATDLGPGGSAFIKGKAPEVARLPVFGMVATRPSGPDPEAAHEDTLRAIARTPDALTARSGAGAGAGAGAEPVGSTGSKAASGSGGRSRTRRRRAGTSSSGGAGDDDEDDHSTELVRSALFDKDVEPLERAAARRKSLAAFGGNTRRVMRTSVHLSRKSRVQRVARNKTMSAAREYVPRALKAEEDARRSRLCATRLVADKMVTGILHGVVNKHLGRFYRVSAVRAFNWPRSHIAPIRAGASRGAQISAEARLRTLFNQREVQNFVVQRLASKTASDAITSALSGHLNFMNRQKEATRRQVKMRELTLTREVSRLKSQLLLSQSKAGISVRNERLRLSRAGSAAGTGVLLEQTIDNIKSVSDLADAKLGELARVTADCEKRLQQLLSPHGHRKAPVSGANGASSEKGPMAMRRGSAAKLIASGSELHGSEESTTSSTEPPKGESTPGKQPGAAGDRQVGDGKASATAKHGSGVANAAKGGPSVVDDAKPSSTSGAGAGAGAGAGSAIDSNGPRRTSPRPLLARRTRRGSIAPLSRPRAMSGGGVRVPARPRVGSSPRSPLPLGSRPLGPSTSRTAARRSPAAVSPTPAAAGQSGESDEEDLDALTGVTLKAELDKTLTSLHARMTALASLMTTVGMRMAELEADQAAAVEVAKAAEARARSELPPPVQVKVLRRSRKHHRKHGSSTGEDAVPDGEGASPRATNADATRPGELSPHTPGPRSGIEGDVDASHTHGTRHKKKRKSRRKKTKYVAILPPPPPPDEAASSGSGTHSAPTPAPAAVLT